MANLIVEVLSDAAAAELAAVGFAHVEYSGEASLLDLAVALGRPIASRPDSPLLDTLKPSRQSDELRPSPSKLYGTGVFPLHTDAPYLRTPPRLVLLRSVHPTYTPTIVCKPTLDGLSQDERRILMRDLWIVRSGHRKFLTTLAGHINGAVVLRYDAGCMRPASPFSDAAARVLLELAGRESQTDVTHRENRVLIVDNWRALHGRGSVHRDDMARSLERVLVS